MRCGCVESSDRFDRRVGLLDERGTGGLRTRHAIPSDIAQDESRGNEKGSDIGEFERHPFIVGGSRGSSDVAAITAPWLLSRY